MAVGPMIGIGPALRKAREQASKTIDEASRDTKIKAEYLNAVNPIVEPTLSADGQLSFANAAVDAGVASALAEYRAAWGIFDNTANTSRPLAES